MTWTLRPSGDALLVVIESPVHDWEGLLESITEQATQGLSIILPTTIPGGTRTDAELLHLLWRLMASRGLSGRSTIA